MAEQSSYSVTSVNKVNRYKHQATYDTATIHDIVNSTHVLHVSFIPDPTSPAPIILPMIGQIGVYPSDATSTPHCYLHGYVSSRLMNLASSTKDEDDPPTLPLCICATKLDGLVLSLTPNSHNYNYRSAVLHGTATLVSDPDEKLWAMRLVTDSVVPGRWDNTRTPPDGAETSSTRIMKVKIESASAKVREGVPEDERKDVKREDVLDSIWTGVVPVYERLGVPVAGPYNRVADVPEHVRNFVERQNREREEYAGNATRKPAPSKRGKKHEE